MRLYLIRHAESEGNVNKLIYSEKRDCEVELTENGRTQSEKIIGNIIQTESSEKGMMDLWYSPYVRAIQTKDIIKETAPTTIRWNEKMNVLLREREWGALQELSNRRVLTDYYFNFFYRPDGGESFADLYQRVVLFHTIMMSQRRSQEVVVVSHGEFLKTYMMFLLNWSIDEFDKYKTPRNATVYNIENIDNETWRLDTNTPLLLRN